MLVRWLLVAKKKVDQKDKKDKCSPNRQINRNVDDLDSFDRRELVENVEDGEGQGLLEALQPALYLL